MKSQDPNLRECHLNVKTVQTPKHDVDLDNDNDTIVV